MNQADLQRLLEIVNGNWGIEAAVLALISAAYLYRHSKSLGLGWRNWLFDLPSGMHVALAVATISAGVCIRGVTIWVWRVFYHAGDLTSSLLGLLLAGAVIGSVGFLWAIIEIGIPIFGNWPWVATIISMVLFTALSLMLR